MFLFTYIRTLVERQVFNFYTDDASIAVTSPLSAPFMNFRPELCRVTFCVTSFHEPGGPAILTNFPRKFVPDVRFLRDQLGTEETGWVVGGRGFRGERGRERERKRSVKQRHSGKVGRRYRAKHPEAG